MAIQHLLERGTHASSVHQAGQILAAATADAFNTAAAAVYVLAGGASGMIAEVVGTGIPATVAAELRTALVGKPARESPVWRAAEQAAAPLLVDDVATSTIAVRPVGFVRTMGFQSFVAIPLLSADGPVGLVICGDRSPRHWTDEDKQLATQLALDGSLVVDSARLRAADRVRLAELTHQVFHDSLTGLPNRASLLAWADHALAGDSGNQHLALLLLDLNDFKQVNDTLGHHVGDQLLQQVAARLSQLLPEADTVVRLGGDEFAVLLTDLPDGLTPATVAARIQHGFQAPFHLDGLLVQAEPSIGIALFPDHATDTTALLQRADVAMYTAKRHRAGPVTYTPADDPCSVDQLQLSSELRRGIADNQLRLHYQPQLDIRTAAVTGVEALVRWQHPRRGQLRPDQFLPMAEATGLIDPLTEWVLWAATAQWQRWADQGLTLDLAVNLSVRALHDPGFLTELTAVLDRYPVADHLILEITETALMADPDKASHTLHQLRALGIRISIDDFGAGYSSLAYLRDLPIDELKIDRVLVTDISRDPKDRAIVETIVTLGHNVGVTVIAEGVEDDTTRTVLAELGCDQIQGFHLSRPLPPTTLTTWLHTDEPACCRHQPPITSPTAGAHRLRLQPHGGRVSVTNRQ